MFLLNFPLALPLTKSHQREYTIYIYSHPLIHPRTPAIHKLNDISCWHLKYC